MRVKRGFAKKRRHKKVLDATKGYRLSYSKLYRRAKEALLHAGQYNFEHRRKRPGQFRRIWIKQLTAMCKQQGTKYSVFINALKKAEVKIDRKVLAYLAVNHGFALEKLMADVKA